MKKPTLFIYGLRILLLLLSMQVFGQNLEPFVPRYDDAIKGDMLLIGNSNIGVHETDPYHGTRNNESSTYRGSMVYVDIDNDASTFNSSMAELDIPSDSNCYRIAYAGLYWSAVVEGDTPRENIKFKTPGSSSYIDITGTQVYYQNSSNDRNSNAFVYYHDVTSLLAGLPNPEGEYMVADISSMTSQMMSDGGGYNQEGLSAGWSLFVIYEDPTMPSQYITSFDGFTKIDNRSPNDEASFLIDGFKTIPVGPVRAKYAFSAIEGDRGWTNDYLEINGTRISATDASGNTIRPSNNFFNSSVSIIDPATNAPILFTDRNPTSSNTLGFDAGIVSIPNPGNNVIDNGDTSATIKLGTNTDIYYFYFSAFAIEIIAPNIVLTKIVEDEMGNDIGGQLVDLGDELYYTIGFQNTGNDDATNLIIRDVLPENIVFNYPTDLGVLPTGVTVQSYDAATREIVFSVDRSVVEENDPVSEIRFMVTVVSSCSLLNDACSNIISNQAFATYQGTINPNFTISNDPSFATNVGCLLTPGATNFLADLNCDFEEEVILCGDSVQLTAGSGYDSYTWSTSPTGTPVIGDTQSITVTEVGTYYVHNAATAPCQSIDQIFHVVTYGAGVENPVIPYADEVVTCPNDGKQLPNIFLCGANDSRNIETGITDATSMIWEILDETSCSAVANEDCANEDPGCTWNQVQTGPNFLVDTAGQYRLTLNYTGGCFNQFYFNVYSNLLVPTVTSRDIYCTTPGEIVVGGVPSGYEYSIDGTNYQTSNTFSITTANLYSVYIRQIGVSPNPCIFSVPDVQIRNRDFTISSIITQPYCHGEMGSVAVAANDVRPQYFFSIYNGATLVNSVGPITASDYRFENLNPGTYTVNVSTEDGCAGSVDVEIIEPPLLEVSAALTNPLTCTDGEITVYPTGGTPPYYYYVNSTTDFQSTPIIPVTTAGDYDILVIDSNNCSAETTITVEATPAPDFTVAQTDITCADNTNSGVIEVNVSNPNGNTLEYSIDNGTTYSNSSVFNGLAAGNYDVVVRYTMGPDVCETAPQTVTITSATAISGTATVTTPYTCLSNGEITVSSVTGGTAPYEYSLDGVNFQSGNTFSGLTEGNYTITIRDASNCTFITAPATIDALSPPTDLDFSATALSCPALTSDVTLTVTGGTSALEYRIVSPTATAFQNSNTFTGLAPDTYTFEVRDANDCSYSESFTIAPLPALTANTVITKSLDCTASPDGLISTDISGGTAPFSYQVSFNGGTYGSTTSVTGNNFVHTAATDGTYQFLITDANNCTVETGVQTINAISLPEITSVVQTQPILCSGDSNAAIQVSINNSVGTPTFTINVFNNTTGTDYGTQTSGLTAGDYTITLTDANSCTDTETITINEPTPITIDYDVDPVSCQAGGVSLGEIIINSVSGGTPNYTYHVTGVNGYNQELANQTGGIQVFEVVDFGLYEIIITDANGCSLIEQDILVASPPDDLDITVSSPPADCSTGGSATVTIGTPLSGSGPFHFAVYTGPGMSYPGVGTWQDEVPVGSESTTFTNLIPGATYTFIVYDEATQCYYYETADTSIPTNSQLSVSGLVSNNITCVGSADGTVSFDINSIYGATTDVAYEIFHSQSLATTGVSGSGTVSANGTLQINDLGNLDFGNYVVVVTEQAGAANAGCSVVSTPFNITESAIDLSITASVDKNANCNPNSGVISATAADGTPPYQYQMTSSATPPLDTDLAWSSASTFNADAGNYYVHVMDAYGCIRSTSVINLGSDPTPVVVASTNNLCTATEGNFEIDVTLPTSGVAPYSYSIDGGAFQLGSAPFTISNLASGTHTVEVRDANGCGNQVSVDIVAPIDLVPEVTAIATCNDDDGEITVTGSGGSGSYNYSISPSPASISLTGNVFSGVPSGTYMVTITDANTSCTADATIVVQQAAPPTFTTTPTAVTCFSDNNGSFEINVNGYSGTYNYEIFDSLGNSVTGSVAANTSTNPMVVNGMTAGSFTVVITETATPFCSASSNVTINSPSEALTLAVDETSNVTCDDGMGTISAVANGGWGVYEYELIGTATVAYSPNGTFSNLSAGTYTVNVRDAGGCIVSENITLNLPTPISATVSASATMLDCFGDDNASITVSASGGQGSNYSYTLNRVTPTVNSSGPQTNSVFNNLGAGTYNVTVTDGYNCEFVSADIVIDQPTPIEVDLVKETSATCLTDASLTLSATGGTGSYEYSNTANFATVIGTFTTSVTFPVSDGTYQYFVRDANGCSGAVSNEITIDPLPNLVINLDTSNAKINCAGDVTGVIVAEAQGGLGNYVYTLQDAVGNDITSVTQDSPGVFTELPAGDYQVEVESGDCLVTSAQVTISEPATPLTANFVASNVTCPGTNNGRLEITAAGGTGIIKYAISPQLNQFFDDPVFENLAPGDYQAMAQDEMGCFVLYDFTIEDAVPVVLSIVPNSIIPEVCSGDMNGEFSIEISGGNMPYSVTLDDYEGNYTTGAPTQTQFDFTGLAGGDHIVYVRDALGCETEWNITFPESVAINPVAEVVFDCVNNISINTVTVSIDESVDPAELDYSLNGGTYQASNIFVDVPAGVGHYVDVRHTNGCIQRTPLFDVEQFEQLQLAIDDGEINQIVAVATGGALPYEFTLNGESYGSQSTFTIYESGDYTVTVTDSNGCTASATRYFEYIDVCIPNYFVPQNGGWGPGCTSQYRNMTFDIFDRYGRKIATLNVDEKWDGNYNGKELPTGDYWYVVKLNDPNDERDFVGHFTLYR